jgi:hypothetical protein
MFNSLIWGYNWLDYNFFGFIGLTSCNKYEFEKEVLSIGNNIIMKKAGYY